MIGKLIGIVFILFVVVFIVVLVCHNNIKPKSKTYDREHIVQFDGHKCSEDLYLTYFAAKYERLAIVVVHNPNPTTVNINNRTYQLNQNSGCGFFSIRRSKHHIFINKRFYLAAKQTLFVIGCATVTKVICVNVNFEHIQFAVYVVTLKFNDTYFNNKTYTDALNVMKFIAADSFDMPFVVLGNFECQNWDYLRTNVLPNTHSSGMYDILTRQCGPEISTPHGVIASKKMNLSMQVGIDYIDALAVKNGFAMIIQFIHDYTSNFKLATDTINMVSNIKTSCSDQNFMLVKKVPNLNDIDKEYKVEHVQSKHIQNITTDSILQYLLRQQNDISNQSVDIER